MAQNNSNKRGTIFVFSAPSGGGKSTIIKHLRKELKNLELSVSVTTRGMREGEKEGEDYYFIDDAKFKKLVENDALYEFVNSDFGPKYGTPKAPVDEWLQKGIDVILDVDYPGVQQLKERVHDKMVTISIIPPSIEVLRQRLIDRGTETPEEIEKRMSKAEKRIEESKFYDHVVVNDDLDVAVNEVKNIILSARYEKNKFLNKEFLCRS